MQKINGTPWRAVLFLRLRFEVACQQPFLSLCGIIEIFRVLVGQEAGEACAEFDPDVICNDGNPTEVVFVLIEEFYLFHRHIDGEVFQHGQI